MLPIRKPRALPTRRVRLSAVPVGLCLLGACLASITHAADPVAANNRGVALMAQFQYEAAAEAFVEALEAAPGDVDIRVNRAIAVLNDDQNGERALPLLLEVLADVPDHLRANYCVGLLLLFDGRVEEAVPYFKRVYEANPNDAYTAYWLGKALESNPQRQQEALDYFERSMRLDPNLRSPIYAAFLLYGRREGGQERSQALLERFQALEDDPRAREADLAYPKMGPYADVVALGEPEPARSRAPKPEGPVFLSPRPLPTPAGRFRKLPASRTASVTVCDIDSNGRLDAFLPGILDPAANDGAHNAVYIASTDGDFEMAVSHPLAQVPRVHAALWGDYDNDGLTDVYLCRSGPNALYRQAERGKWVDVTEASGTAGGDYVTVDGVFVDADHDGDLDLFLANSDGPNELFNNDRTGAFRPLAAKQGLTGRGKARQVAVGDFDNDRDLDLLVLNVAPPHEVYLNDRTWRYQPDAPGFDALIQTRLEAVVVGDVDTDGRTEIFGIRPGGFLDEWQPNADGSWQPTPLAVNFPLQPNASAELGLADVTGDGALELLASSGTNWQAIALDPRIPLRGSVPLFDPTSVSASVWLGLLAGSVLVALLVLVLGRPRLGRAAPPLLITCVFLAFLAGWALSESGRAASSLQGPIAVHNEYGLDIAGWGLANFDVTQGPSLLMVRRSGVPQVAAPGPGRYPFTGLTFSGREDKGNSLRTNASGIGAEVQVRVGSDWTVLPRVRPDSTPGQSLQPWAVGLAGRDRIDFVRIEWPDGVLQSEIDLAGGELHRITEVQRQTGSCPVLFTWDGSQYVFQSDVLGVGGLGYLLAPGEYAPPDPNENYLLPPGSLAQDDGKYRLTLAEPMEEVCYLDAVGLTAYDLPSGWSMVLDERFAITEPWATGEPIFYWHERLPVAATDAAGNDVLDAVRTADHVAVDVGPLDTRFLGRLASEHVLTLDFGAPLVDGPGEPALVIDGWVEYPYSQTMFAAWQAEAAYHAPTLEAGTPDGSWQPVAVEFGYPAGMPRRMALPLAGLDLPPGATKLRLRTNQEIYWDRVAVVYAEPCPDVVTTRLPLLEAELRYTGFPERTTFPQRRPWYDYAHRPPMPEARTLRGWYTAFGDVAGLVGTPEGDVAIFGAGEEVRCTFDGASLARPASGSARWFVVELAGWCKDGDLYTKDGDTVAPLPGNGDPRPHTRYRSQ